MALASSGRSLRFPIAEGIKEAIQHVAKIAHIDPTPAVGALDEVLPLVLRFATMTLADDPARPGARTVGRSVCSHERGRPNEARL